MTTIHLQPENSHATAADMKRSAETIAAQLQSLQNAAGGLDSAWQGGAQAEFSAGLGDLLRSLQSQQETFAQLADRLERETLEWEEVDRRGAAAWHGLISSLGTSGGGGGGGGSGGGAGGWSLPDWVPYVAPIVPIITIISIVDNVIDMPDWMDDIIHRIFPPAPRPVVSPVPDEPVPVTPTTKTDETASPSAQPAEPVTPEQPPAPPVETPEEYDIYHQVDQQSQGDRYGNTACSPTSVSMVTDYFHKLDPNNPAISTDRLLEIMDKSDGTPGVGISLSDLTDELNENGYNNITTEVDATMDNLKKYLADGPVIVTTGVALTSNPRDLTGPGSTSHAMVVTGISGSTVVVNDPWSGKEVKVPIDQFEKMWKKGQNGLFAIRP